MKLPRAGVLLPLVCTGLKQTVIRFVKNERLFHMNFQKPFLVLKDEWIFFETPWGMFTERNTN